jgi:hypothetical protein
VTVDLKTPNLSKLIGLFIAIVAVLPFGLIACGGNTNAASFHRSAHEHNARDQARAETIVLRSSDFPSGWRRAATGGTAGNASCVNSSLSRLTWSGKAESGRYGRDAMEVASTVVIFTTAREARTALERMSSSAFNSCLIASLKKRSHEGIRVASSKVSKLSFPSMGDRSTATHIEFNLEANRTAIKIASDLVLVQRQRALLWLTFNGVTSPFDPALKRQLATIVNGRMASLASRASAVSR